MPNTPIKPAHRAFQIAAAISIGLLIAGPAHAAGSGMPWEGPLYEKFLLGADYIQLYTGMVFQGPNIAGSIKKELKELLIRDGVKNFTEIIGNKTLS